MYGCTHDFLFGLQLCLEVRHHVLLLLPKPLLRQPVLLFYLVAAS
jgi:hypothetical protein